MSSKRAEKQVSRRVFLIRSIALAAGCASAATGILSVWKGKRADPFLSKDSLAVLKRFGSDPDFIDALPIPSTEQAILARRVAKLAREFAARQSLFRRGDFHQALRGAIERDFARKDVIAVNNWILSKTEVGIYVFNKLRRSGTIVS